MTMTYDITHATVVSADQAVHYLRTVALPTNKHLREGLSTRMEGYARDSGVALQMQETDLLIRRIDDALTRGDIDTIMELYAKLKFGPDATVQ